MDAKGSQLVEQLEVERTQLLEGSSQLKGARYGRAKVAHRAFETSAAVIEDGIERWKEQGESPDATITDLFPEQTNP